MDNNLTHFLQWYRTSNPQKSKATYDAMRYNLTRLCKLFECEFDDLNKDNLLIDPENTKKLLRDKYSLNTTIQTILGIKWYLLFKGGSNNLVKKYEILLKELTEENQAIIEQNELTDNEKVNWINYPNLQERIKQVFDYQKDMDFHQLRNLTMVAMYVFLPPARIGNYSKMVVRYVNKNVIKLDTQTNSYPKKHNYLFINQSSGKLHLVFNQYKTAKYVGQKVLTLTAGMTAPFGDLDSIYQILSYYIQKREEYFGNKKTHYTKVQPLFFNLNNKKAIEGSHFTDILKETTSKYVGKTLSVNLFRHIFITDFLKKETSIEDKKRVAGIMGQTYTPTMMEKYNRVKIEEVNGGEEANTTSSGMVLHFE